MMGRGLSPVLASGFLWLMAYEGGGFEKPQAPLIEATAAIAAVSARRISGARERGWKLAARRAALSVGVKSPSGPITI
jgi:hypothetical protein